MRQVNKALHDQRGSSIVIVLVTMTFIVVLASIVMYLSLVNIQMKNMDRSGKENFYDAESVMNELRARVQVLVSDAINDAYTDVLSNYNDTEDESQEKAFKTSDETQEGKFRDAFLDALYTSTVGSSQFLFDPLDGSDDIKTYYTAALKALLKDVDGVEIEGSQTVVEERDGDDVLAIKLKDVRVTYVANGYQTSVSADIRIETPSLLYKATSTVQSSLPDYAIIAEDGVETGFGKLVVTGNAYAGMIETSGNSNSLTIRQAGDFVVGGNVTIEDSSSFELEAGSSLWAENIVVGASAKANIRGDAYISNDLNLSSLGAEAYLSGRYFGYGNATEPEEDGVYAYVPDNSSSIMVNGKYTTLDLSGLKTLILAGHSFVNYSPVPGADNPFVMMGQSIAVKSDQLAYLVPENCLKTDSIYGLTNPYIYNDEGDITAALEAIATDEPIFKDSTETLADYGITDVYNDILVMRKQIGQTNIAYFCMKFPTTEDANAYFKDYFKFNKDTVQKYLSIYTDAIDMSSSTSQSLAGQGYYLDAGVLEMLDASNVPDATLEAIVEASTNLRVTLSRTDNGGGSGAASPYEYYVDIETDILAAEGGTIAYETDGVAKAIVTSGSYTITDDTPDSVHIVIAAGDVTVNRAFSGLILSGGTVHLNASITASRSDVADALLALVDPNSTDADKRYLHLNAEHITPLNVSSGNASDLGNWDMNRLVSYDNWAKNAG